MSQTVEDQFLHMKENLIKLSFNQTAVSKSVVEKSVSYPDGLVDLCPFKTRSEGLNIGNWLKFN